MVSVAETVADGRPCVSQWVRMGDRLFTYKEYEIGLQRFKSIKVITLNSEFKVSSVLQAEEAQYLHMKNSWLLKRILEERFDDAMHIVSRSKREQGEMDLPIHADLLTKDLRSDTEMSRGELSRKVQVARDLSQPHSEAQFLLQSRRVNQLIMLLLPILGFLFGLNFQRVYPIRRSFLIVSP